MYNNIPLPLILAYTSGHLDHPSRLRWAVENAFAVEYSPDPERLDLLPEKIQPFISAGIPLRFHARYPGYELGHADSREARKALEVHIRTLKKIRGPGEQTITVHTGLDPDIPVVEANIIDNLSRLVEFASKHNITVCLENMRKGHAGNPYNVLKWSLASGAMITFDTGHAFGCSMVLDSLISPLDFVDLFNSRIFEVHIYGKEDEKGHHPIEDIKPFEPLIDRLLQIDCRWWTVELHDPDEACSALSMIKAYLVTGNTESTET